MLQDLINAIGLLLSGDPAFWQIVGLSLWVSGLAVLLGGVMGVPIGAWLGLRDFRGRAWLTAFIYTGMGFPPLLSA